MSYVVEMPELGSETDSGTIVEWFVDEGGEVEEDAAIAEIESEGTTAEIDAREAGVLRHVGVEVGESAPPGAALAIVAGADEDISASRADFEAGGEADEPSADAESDPEAVELPNAAATASVGPDLKGTVEAGSFEYDFDVTEEFGGGTAPTPVDLFVGSLAACLSSSIGIQADIRDVEMRTVTVDAEATPPEGSVESVSLTVTLDVDADEETLERIVRNGERTCHVNELLREDLPVSVEWRRA